MKKIKDYINNNLLIKIASLNSVSVMTRIVAGFVTSKFIALYIGPSGLAFVGNLRDFFSTLQSFSNLGFYNGVVKYVAEFKKDTLKLSQTLSTVSYCVLASTIVLSIFCFFGADMINRFVFIEGDNYAYLIRIISAVLPFYAINSVILAFLNGLSNFRRLVAIQILGHIFGTLLTIFLIYNHHIQGALLAVVLSEVVLFFITLASISKSVAFFSLIKFRLFDINKVKKLGSFSMMSLFTALTAPLVMLSIRNHIIDTQALVDAGYWEAMNRLSRYYLMFVTSLLTLYVLPRFSEIQTSKEFRHEILGLFKTILPVFALLLIAIYFLRHIIIEVVFSKEFAPVEGLFFWQLIGDFIKVVSVIIATQLLAKRMIWHYLITEALSFATLYVASIYLIDRYGVIGATMAHFVNYLVYMVLILVVFRNSLFGKLKE
ncbi:PST family polysaccharide transporter [Gelidibacter algens]|uniref:PST family polysaccharide transporter n=1 Tax=Gelidibacter algens TaxID=49280 RepID=A0A1A7R8I1_9FLAO|nr:O-antigen translocase [Gelidibacter algens]OBX27037.1 lipopolysaccharide biosynthesis protein [Gelidibacter algens]RAJ28022.1 PST family polysaccharide transporter [Gelidibacter algens]